MTITKLTEAVIRAGATDKSFQRARAFSVAESFIAAARSRTPPYRATL